MHKILTLLLIAITSIEAHAANHRGGAELLNPGAYSVNTSAMVFQTSAYYNTEGEEVEKPEGQEFRLIDVDLNLNYGVSRNLEIGAAARFRMVSSTINEVTTDNSGPESLAAEIKYAFPQVGQSRYAIGAHYRQTLYSNATYDDTLQLPIDEIDLGDGGSEYGVDLFWTYVGNPAKFDARVGYSSPSNDLSEEITYKVEGLYRMSSLGLFAGVEGIYSLKKDEFSEDPLLKPAQSTGATLLFNSINREKIAPYIGAHLYLDKFIIGVKAQTVFAGSSTDKGHTIGVNLGWNSGGVTAESIKIDSFKEYNIDGSVLKVSARGNFLRIDQGLSTDVEKGMKFDIYQTDYFGGNVLVATGIVYEVGTDWSVIKLLKKYKDIQIKPGFAARGY